MIKNNLLRKTWAKYALLFFVFMLIIGFLASFYIKNKALEKITTIPGIICENVAFNLFSGCLDLENLSIERAIGAEKKELLTLTSSKIQLHGFSYWQFLRNNKICVNDFLFTDLDLEITNNKTASESDTIATNSSTANKPPEEILIKHFGIQNGHLAIQNKDFKKLSLDTFTTEIQQLQFFPARDTQQLIWENIAFIGQQFLVDRQESDNQLIAKAIELTTTENLQIKDVRWKPKYGKNNYLKHHQFRKSRIDARIPMLEIHQFPIADLVFQQQLKAKAVVARNGLLKIYSDKNKPECTDCVKDYHYEHLIASDLLIDIDSILIKNSEIVLEVLDEGKTKAGKLDWSNVYASIYNLTNNKTKATSHPNTVADIQAIFVDDGQVKLHFEFPNFDKNADYRFKGSLDKVKLKKINSFLVFSKQFRIKQGEVNSFVFNGRGNLQAATGDMELRYNNLALQLLKKDRTPRKFLSKIANALLSKEKNPDKDNQLHRGKMYFERDLSKSFISNWWKTMQSGIKSTMLPNILLPDELESTTK